MANRKNILTQCQNSVILNVLTLCQQELEYRFETEKQYESKKGGFYYIRQFFILQPYETVFWR